MDVNVLIIPEAIGCILFTILIIRLALNRQNATVTPFFVFFYSTGIVPLMFYK